MGGVTDTAGGVREIAVDIHDVRRLAVVLGNQAQGLDQSSIDFDKVFQNVFRQDHAKSPCLCAADVGGGGYGH